VKAANDLLHLPPNTDVETTSILRKAIRANVELARLKGYCLTIPNDRMLVNAIVLKEAQASSEIENIITTQDKLYQALSVKDHNTDPATKEILNYREALWKGHSLLQRNNLLTTNAIVEIQEHLEGDSAGIRKLPGTALVNDRTGETVYVPPDNPATILSLLANLEKYLNASDETDPLIKMAIAHYQFESIHPFYDGNGRTGRILNVLYLVKTGLLDQPILCLSDYIISRKEEYYRRLQNIRDKNSWSEFIEFMLVAVETTSKATLQLIESIRSLMETQTAKAKQLLPSASYSKELLELLFVQPYTKIEFLVQNGIAERRTASKYLKQLEEIGILLSKKIWRESIYVNMELYELLKTGR
jgi:Fic family protein